MSKHSIFITIYSTILHFYSKKVLTFNYFYYLCAVLHPSISSQEINKRKTKSNATSRQRENTYNQSIN